MSLRLGLFADSNSGQEKKIFITTLFVVTNWQQRTKESLKGQKKTTNSLFAQ